MNEGSTMMIRPHRAIAGLLMALLLLAQAVPITRAQSGPLYFPATGHFLTDDQGFLSFWRAGGRLEFFGAPISEAIWEMTAHGQQEVQYFERARLERDAGRAGTPDEVRVSNLGSALALLRGQDIAPVDNYLGAETYGPDAP